MMNMSSDLELDVNELVQEYGLIAILETLKEFVKTRAEALEAGDRKHPSDPAATFRQVSDTLQHLVETLPTEIDVELALVQLTHPTIDTGDTGDERLAGGLE